MGFREAFGRVWGRFWDGFGRLWEPLGRCWALSRLLYVFFRDFLCFQCRLSFFVSFCCCWPFLNSFDCFVLVWVVFGSPANFQILSTRRATRAQRALRGPRAVVSYFSLFFVVSSCFQIFCLIFACFYYSHMYSRFPFLAKTGWEGSGAYFCMFFHKCFENCDLTKNRVFPRENQ